MGGGHGFPRAAGGVEALEEVVRRGVFGYFGDESEYLAAIAGWMERRHGWEVDPAAILSAHGLVAAVGHCIETFTEPGEAVVLFTPVYHAFARIITATGGRWSRARWRSRTAATPWIWTPGRG